MPSETTNFDYLALKDEGNALYSAGDFLGAVQKYSKALKLCADNNTDRTTLLKNRAAAYLNLQEYQKVIDDTSTALKRNPSDENALFHRCQAYEQLGKFNEAFNDARAVNCLNPRHNSIQPYLSRLQKNISQDFAEEKSGLNTLADLQSVYIDLSYSDSSDSEGDMPSLPLVQRNMRVIVGKVLTNIAPILKKKKDDEKMKKSAKQAERSSILNDDSNTEESTFNSLPDDIHLKIFSFLSHNELAEAALVCRKWNRLARNPVFWKKVHVDFVISQGSQNVVAECFIDILPSLVTCLRMNYCSRDEWVDLLNFEEVCSKLGQKCPGLKTLTVENANFSNSLSCIIETTSMLLLNLKKLCLRSSSFTDCSEDDEYWKISKIEVLDLSGCHINQTHKSTFLKLPHLKILVLSGTNLNDRWFVEDEQFIINVLKNLYQLHISNTKVSSVTFKLIQLYALNLRELSICNTGMDLDNNNVINLNKAIFPHLKTICLRYVTVTCENIISLIKACPSLQNVYIEDHICNSYREHPYVVMNESKLQLVKDDCCMYNKPRYFLS